MNMGMLQGIKKLFESYRPAPQIDWKDYALYRDAAKLIKHFEGYRPHIYDDATGKPIGRLASGGNVTIGYGFNLSANDLPQEMSEQLLQIELQNAVKDCRAMAKFFDDLSHPRKLVYVDMMYNMGLPRFLRFKEMHRYANLGRFELVLREMKDSAWFNQVGKRRTGPLMHMMQFNELAPEVFGK